VDITCISDLHGFYPKLEGGDLLIVAGDLTARNTIQEYDRFFDWLSLQPYKKKVYIGGNHDDLLANRKYSTPKYCDASYLCDSGTEFEYTLPVRDLFNSKQDSLIFRRKLKIWGSPWTHLFPGVNPHCTAFMIPEEELAAKWALIPDDVDILVTHGPPFTVLDKTKKGAQVGSPSLMAAHLKRLRPKLWVFGHIHEAYGEDGPYEWNDTLYVNASIMNECYEPVNKPIGVVL
jgi:Icc-related predicted phosphoesterase